MARGNYLAATTRSQQAWRAVQRRIRQSQGRPLGWFLLDTGRSCSTRYTISRPRTHESKRQITPLLVPRPALRCSHEATTIWSFGVRRSVMCCFFFLETGDVLFFFFLRNRRCAATYSSYSASARAG